MSTATQIESIVLGPHLNGIQMTPDEFDAVTEYDDRYGYELIDGVLIVNPPPLPQERGPNEILGHLLRTYQESHPQGLCLDDTLPEELVMVEGNRRRADRVIWAGLGRQPKPKDDTPTIVVEFVSEGRRSWRRDYLEKRDEYLAAGVVEYWVIDRFDRKMTVYRKSDNKRGWQQKTVQEHDVYRPQLLPGFELPLARILAVADRWVGE